MPYIIAKHDERIDTHVLALIHVDTIVNADNFLIIYPAGLFEHSSAILILVGVIGS